jgi:predicted nucleic acid-binding protein
MASFFLDSSAIVKRYVVESGSRWVADMMHPAQGNQIHVAGISGAEVVAALARRVALGGSSRSRLLNAIAEFRSDFSRRFDIVDVSAPLIFTAMDLAERYALRGYDSVQLAAATMVNLEYAAFGGFCTLVSADAELNAAALAEGLRLENPNNYP